MHAGSNLPTMATTRAPCSTISGIRTFSTPFATPSFLQTGFETFGGTDFPTSVKIPPKALVVPFLRWKPSGHEHVIDHTFSRDELAHYPWGMNTRRCEIRLITWSTTRLS